jgi:hypothetical protein
MSIANHDGEKLLRHTAADDLLRLGLLGAALAIGFVPLFQFIGSMVWFHRYLGDWNVFWGIETAPLKWVYGHYLPVYPYAPTGLMLFRPFGLLPFWPALVAWGLAGVTAVSFAFRPIVPSRAIALGFITCAGIDVLVQGQTSLFIGALVVAGVSARDPRWRGGFMATAAVIKPQAVLAAPIAMIAARDWRAIAWAIVTACGLFMLSLLIFGPETWMRWASEIPRFQAWVVSHGIDRLDVGLYGLVTSSGLPGWTFVAGIPLGLVTSWLAFRREVPLLDRYAAFAVSSVLMSPYTLRYDLSGLNFVCLAMLLDRRRSPLTWLAAALIVSSVFASLGIILLAVTQSWTAFKLPARLPSAQAAFSTFRTSSSAASPR